MKPETDADKLNLDFQRRADFDFIKRALPGVYLYLFAWPLIFLSTGFFRQNPIESSMFGALFTIVCALRLIHGRLTAKYYDSHYKAWNLWLTSLSLIHAATWGALFYLVNLVPRYEELSVLVNLVIAGIASASVQSLIPKFDLTRWYISILLLPVCFATAISGEQLQLCIIVLMFWLYLMFVGKRYRSEYARAFRIEKALSEKQIELHKLNRTDPLTQSHNRRCFTEHFESLWQRCILTQQPLSLLMLDIDHFKSINDDFGHPTGDQCLVHFVKTISPITEQYQAQLYRYGGEEFAILVQGKNEAQTAELAEQTRTALESTPLNTGDSSIRMTLSAGTCCVVPTVSNSKIRLIELADKALYSAKTAGRNRVAANQYPSANAE
ncbi:GGDEF domain-containing protein [Planctobacterium marinum]|uniref:GGDEF domain-containing protein n=1 Tax=Planctobacterium marinum TaxID=1631968 RepID=UPI001E5E5B37|nr:GGDEF domain-containing protein [Planctobacterium marinum]MCC2607609.1 GGDEF domain-containing protein [Planctobacterium marinum]